jgi:hypothetical protein
VSPLRGGESDKFGNRYEGRWTTRQLLYVLLGQADSVTVEPVGEIGEGVEFTVRRGDAVDVHQVKRQNASANGWSLPDLSVNGVLAAAKLHVSSGRKFWFVSTTPAVVLDQLADAARRSGDLGSFVEYRLSNAQLRSAFDYLSGTVYGSAETAWRTLRGIEASWTSEQDLEQMNSALAGLLLEGAEPSLAAVGLGNLVPDNLGIPLTRDTLTELLSPLGLHCRQLIGNPAIRQRVQDALRSWEQSVARELLQPEIARSESRILVDHIRNGPGRMAFVTGSGGSGKSAVLRQAVADLSAAGWPVLPLRLDQVEPFSSTTELGSRRNLEVSPVTALAAAGGSSTASLLVIDQLDAVSLASGRMPEHFDVITDLLREAAAFPQMRVVLACRSFDVQSDERIRAVAAAEEVTRIEVTGLSDGQVDCAVRSMQLRAESLTASQRRLLRIPLHLALLRTIADEPNALSFTTSHQLFDAYWDRKERDCRRRRPGIRVQFAEVIGVLAEAMSERQQLFAPRWVLDVGDLLGDADVLASEHVLVVDGQKISFFHESFFEYAFARRWLARRRSLVEFLRRGEQELFRRGQVRTVLAHLRDHDPNRYISEAESVLVSTGIRFHIQDAVLAFLHGLEDPTAAEWRMMERLAAASLSFGGRLRLTMRSVHWFDRLDADGIIGGWLAGTDASDHLRAIEVMLGAAADRPDRIAALIAPHAGRPRDYPAWLAWVTRPGNMSKSRSLFELVLEAVRRGDYKGIEHGLWIAAHGLGERRPAWAVELLAAYLADRPGAFELDDAGRVRDLSLKESVAEELATHGAEEAPQAFCDLLVPYMRQAMKLTQIEPSSRPVRDRHFSDRHPVDGPANELDNVLLRAAAAAVRKLAVSDQQVSHKVLEALAADPHDAAQWLLYEGLRMAGERWAEWTGSLLLEGSHRLTSGYVENPFWTTRMLLQATTPYMREEPLRSLEHQTIQLRPARESRHRAGLTSFTLLSGITERRLSEAGRRRLGELRRRFGVSEPPAPRGMQVGRISSPIPSAGAKHMTDDQWLTAMARHSGDRVDFETGKGGAYELSTVLKEQAAADPRRFARLALRITGQANPAYGIAILHALAGVEDGIDPALVFDVVRHVASLGSQEYDIWLGWPLRPHLDRDIPDDIIQIILDRALHSLDPTEDAWLPTRAGGPLLGGDIWMCGFNSARGHCAVILGDILMRDADGRRTALVVPDLGRLAADPTVEVRSCVAHVLTACLRHARTATASAFRQLVATDDRLLSTRTALDLMTWLAPGEPGGVEPVITRMLNSAYAEVREAGGQMAAFAGLELGLGPLLARARSTQDAPTRKGAAFTCARRLPRTDNANEAAAALGQFFRDQDDGVRKTAAEVAGVLRGHSLQPFASVLTALIASPAFEDAVPQLLITLQYAPDRIDDLVILCARRFLDTQGPDAGNITTAAAARAPEIGKLILRACAQAEDPGSRAELLNLIDDILLSGAYGFEEMVQEAEH